MKKQVNVFVWMLGITTLLLGCKKEDNFSSGYPPVNIDLKHVAAGAPLKLGQTFANPHGEPLEVTAFKYYLSNFSLKTLSGTEVVLHPEYFLVDEGLASSKNFFVYVPEGTYESMRMLIGVDSIRNVSGIQSGALDPSNGMFWSWNTGYIFAKLEGKSSVSTAPLQNVTYHIGGFKQAESSLQFVTLFFPTPLQVKQGGSAAINLSANIDTWFNAVNQIKIAEAPFIMNPGNLAQSISENYANMFTVVSVKN
jgi:hypothetical protein